MSESFPKVEVSIFSSLLPPSLPLPRTAAPEPTNDYWSLALEYNALPWRRACNRPNRCVFQLCVFMKKSGLHRVCEQKAMSLSVQIKGLKRQTSHALEKGNRLVPGPSQSTSNPLSLFGQRCVCKRDTPSNSLYRGCGLCREMDTSGVRSGNRFQSLHLTKDILC